MRRIPPHTNKYKYRNNNAWDLLQTPGGKDEPNIVLCGNRNGLYYAVIYIVLQINIIIYKSLFIWLNILFVYSGSCAYPVHLGHHRWLANKIVSFVLFVCCNVIYEPTTFTCLFHENCKDVCNQKPQRQIILW